MLNKFLIRMNTQERELPEVEVLDDVTAGSRVILFNDEFHTFEDVIFQLIKAINCTMDIAESLTWEVHSNGKACVFDGDINECLRVSSILEEIALHTQVEF